MEPGKYPYVSPKKVSLVMIEDITETARYPLVKAHGKIMLKNYLNSVYMAICDSFIYFNHMFSD